MYSTPQTFAKTGFLFFKEKRKHQLQALFVEKVIDSKASIQHNLRNLSPEIDTGYLVSLLNIHDFLFDKRFSFATSECNKDGSIDINPRLKYDAVIPVKIIFEISAITFGFGDVNVDAMVIFNGQKLITHVKNKPPEWGQPKSVTAIPVQ